MYNGEDRSWMYDRPSDDNYWNNRYMEGVGRFVDYVFSRTDILRNGKAKCPCCRCCNRVWLDSESIRIHLYNRGFVDHYHVWTSHGESRRTVAQSNTPDNEPSSSTTSNLVREMVHDHFGGRFENVNISDASIEEPNKEAQMFFELLQAAETPLNDGSNVSLLSWVAHFMANKSEHKASAVYCDKVIESVHWLLSPEVSEEIPKDVRGMKKLLRSLGLGKKTFDVCENDCFLFYGDYESSNHTRCPVCGAKRYEDQVTPTGTKKRIALKKLWYFPLTPRLQRLYMARRTAEHMTWHLKCRDQNDTMIHPACGDAWKVFDDTYPEYAAEPRNVRLGLCTDGFTPWNNGSSTYSCWPVFVTPYNLPPDLCMRREYIFLSLLIAGPRSPGKNIDVMLRPLIDELRSLWDNGVETYDSFRKDNFVMRAHVMWTISDFPAYGMLSQWSTHGKLSCPYCMENTKAHWLKSGGKYSFFDCHRRFLPMDHPWRENTRDFLKGESETDPPLHRRLGPEMIRHVRCLENVGYGKNTSVIPGFGEYHNWTHRSIFWELPYWGANLIRHNLDVMHCEKNFFDNIKNTVMDDPERTKDNMKARLDLQELTNIKELFVKYRPSRQAYKKKAIYCLSREQKMLVCNWLRGIKFCDGYASNLKRCVQLPQLKITGMKSHDCHVFMQCLLPIAFRDLLPKSVWEPIVEVSLFFKALCSTELSRKAMEQLESSIVITMCKLEKIFPPSFFDSMEHLAIHLPWEAKVGGPVHYRWMYPFERQMLELKKGVGNRARIEGSICEAFLISEATNFSSQYFEQSIETRANRLNRNEVSLNTEFEGELSIYRTHGAPVGSGKNYRQFTTDERKAAETYILQNCPEIEPFLSLFDNEVCHGLSGHRIQQSRNNHFVQWLRALLESNRFNVDPRITAFVKGPSMTVRVRKGYVINGFKFHTMDYAARKKTNNYGVYVKGSSNDTEENYFYGVLKEVLEVNFWHSGRPLKVILFKCHWFNLNTGLRVHEKYPLVEIDPNQRLATNDTEPFILASQAQQCCYIPYPSQENAMRKGWWVVCPMRARYIVDMTSQSNVRDVSREASDIYQDSIASQLRFEVDISSFGRINLADNQLQQVDPNAPHVDEEEPYEIGDVDEEDEEEEDDSDPDYS